MFHIVNHNTLIHALFSIWLREMYPCMEENIIMMGGTKDRNIWRMRLGRYPVITSLTKVLQNKKIAYSCIIPEKGIISWIKSPASFKFRRMTLNQVWRLICTYSFSMPFRKGNQVSNWSRLVSPCTSTTGIRNRIVRAIHATNTTSTQIHLFMNESEKNGQ